MTTNSKPQFYYFKVLVLGQLVRFTLNYLNVDFEDNYVASIDDEFRKSLKFGQLPLYIDADGFRLSQTDAICKYIAGQHDFLGKTLKEKALVDEAIAACHDDCIIPSYKVAKGEFDIKVIDTMISRQFTSFEKALTENKFIAGGETCTLADLYVFVAYHYIGTFLGHSEKLNGKLFPKLEELSQYFLSNERVASYIQNRPVPDRRI